MLTGNNKNNFVTFVVHFLIVEVPTLKKLR